MMISPEMFVEECKDCSYMQLIEKRDELIREIEEFEETEKSGMRDNDAWTVCPGPSLVYCMNMEYLCELLKLMREKYDEDTLMVDETDENMQLSFARNVIWNENEYINGMPSERVIESKKILNKLADINNPDAMNMKGAMYFEGRGEEKNYKEAIKWYKKAADAGCSLAMSNLAFIYFYGNGTVVDPEKAYMYCSMAVQRDEWDALNLLGDMYREGVYVPKDEKMALEMYDRCFRKAHHNATNDAYPACLVRIAELLYKSDKITTNHFRAYDLLKEAEKILIIQIEKGNYYAKIAIDRVKKDIREVEDMQDEANRICEAFQHLNDHVD